MLVGWAVDRHERKPRYWAGLLATNVMKASRSNFSYSCLWATANSRIVSLAAQSGGNISLTPLQHIVIHPKPVSDCQGQKPVEHPAAIAKADIVDHTSRNHHQCFDLDIFPNGIPDVPLLPSYLSQCSSLP